MTLDQGRAISSSSSSEGSIRSGGSNGFHHQRYHHLAVRGHYQVVVMNSNYMFGGQSKSEGGNSPPGGGKQAIGRCGVCGDKAYFHNFNALTCQACKAFFRRNAKKYWRWKCPFKDSCQMNDTTRKCCRSCRIKKCFEIGMRPDLIRSPTYSPKVSMASTSDHRSQPPPLVRKNCAVAQPDFNLERQHSKHWYTTESQPWPPPTLMSYLVSNQTECRPDQVASRRMSSSGEKLRKRPFSEPHNRNANEEELKDCSQDFPVIPMSFINVLDLEEETKLYELLYECKMMESSIKLDDKSLVTNTNDMTNTTNCDTEKPSNVPFNNWLQYAISDVTTNTQRIKSFSYLDLETRMNVMKHVTLQIFLLKMIACFNSEKDCVEWRCNFLCEKHEPNTNDPEVELTATLKAEALKKLETSFYENFSHLISDLDSQNWRQDMMVMSLLSAIILYDPSYARSAQETPKSPTSSSSRSNSSSSASLFSLVSPEIKITNERDVYIKILKKYLNHKSNMVHSISISDDDVNVKLFETLFGIKNLSAILESIDLSKQTLTLNVLSNN